MASVAVWMQISSLFLDDESKSHEANKTLRGFSKRGKLLAVFLLVALLVLLLVFALVLIVLLIALILVVLTIVLHEEHLLSYAGYRCILTPKTRNYTKKYFDPKGFGFCGY